MMSRFNGFVASFQNREAVETAGRSHSVLSTGLKAGVNERESKSTLKV